MRRYDDEAIVFNPRSWETHLLNPAAALVLDVLCREPHSVASLHAALSEECDATSMQVLDEASLELLLEQLESLHLIAAVD